MRKRTLYLISILLIATLIRVIALDKYPAGLNADEAAIGYNAWSLLDTGKDEHSNSWPLVFRSFDDYKPPVYFYLVLPFVKFMGPSVWAVRLPSAILGVISIYLLYLLVQNLFPKNKHLPLISALLLTLSPWHIHFSRGGWEVNAALFLILLSLVFFLKSYRNIRYLFLFGLTSVVAMYTYHSARIVLPLLVLGLFVINLKESLTLFRAKNLKITLAALFISLILIIPLASQLLSKEGQSRFNGVSIFADEGPLWQALELRRAHEKETFLVKVIHNRYLSYGLRFTKNYLSHFSPRFLFVTGDEIARSRVPGVGQSLIVLFPFFAAGLIGILKQNSPGKKFFLYWFLVSPLAASLTFQSPHALRAQNMVVPLTLITAMGIIILYRSLAKFPQMIISLLVTLCLLLLTYDFGYYLHAYYLHYPKELPYAWQYGFDQIGSYVKDNYDKYDKIIISDRYDQPYILMAFFLKYDPETLQKELVLTPRDKFGFSTVKNFGKMEFRKINFGEDRKIPNALILEADEGVDEKNVIHTIYDPAGKQMYRFAVSDQYNKPTP